MIISIIAAVGKNFEIGFNNKLLWNIPADMKNFVKLTKGKPIIIGRKTFESFKGPLPNRLNVILTTNSSYTYEDENVVVFNDIDKALEFLLKKDYEEVVICGGAEIYKRFLSLADRFYMSFVDWEGKADTFFPEFDFTNLNLCTEKDFAKDGDVPSWIFREYSR